MATASTPAFVLVKSTNPHREGQYGRGGLRFSRDWRALQVDELDDRDVTAIAAAPATPTTPAVVAVTGVNNMPLRATRGEDNLISKYTLELYEADSFLVVKPATQSDVDKFQAAQAENGGDKDATIEALQAKNADLEARLMRLEQAAPGKKGGGTPATDNATK